MNDDVGAKRYDVRRNLYVVSALCFAYSITGGTLELPYLRIDRADSLVEFVINVLLVLTLLYLIFYLYLMQSNRAVSSKEDGFLEKQVIGLNRSLEAYRGELKLLQMVNADYPNLKSIDPKISKAIMLAKDTEDSGSDSKAIEILRNFDDDEYKSVLLAQKYERDIQLLSQVVLLNEQAIGKVRKAFSTYSNRNEFRENAYEFKLPILVGSLAALSIVFRQLDVIEKIYDLTFQ